MKTIKDSDRHKLADYILGVFGWCFVLFLSAVGWVLVQGIYRDAGWGGITFLVCVIGFVFTLRWAWKNQSK